MDAIRKAIRALRKQLIALLQAQVTELQTLIGSKPNAELLYKQATLYLGKDASPLDIVADEVGCAESVTEILRQVIDYPITVGTWTLNDMLSRDSRFLVIREIPQKGDIIISPTGTGNGTIRGHVGIVGLDNVIMSARSDTGLWSTFYNLDTWKARYVGIGGFPVNYYRII